MTLPSRARRASRTFSRKSAVWTAFALFAVHNVEEQAEIGGFLEAHRDFIPPFLESLTAGRFAVSLILATLIGLVAARFAAISRIRGPWLVFFLAFQIGMAVNTLQHTAIGFLAGGYAPGTATGLALVLPYAVYLVRRSLREKWVGVKPLVITSLAVILLTPPLILLLHGIALLIV